MLASLKPRPNPAWVRASCRRVSNRSGAARNRIPSPPIVARTLHPTIGVRPVFLHRGELCHMRVMRRLVAHWVGGPGITGEQEGLAAAAAEVDLAPLAACTRLGQEIGAAECIEGRRR